MAIGWDEIKTTVNTVVYNISAVKAAFIAQVSLKLVVDVLNYGPEAEKVGNINKHHQLNFPPL